MLQEWPFVMKLLLSCNLENVHVDADFKVHLFTKLRLKDVGFKDFGVTRIISFICSIQS